MRRLNIDETDRDIALALQGGFNRVRRRDDLQSQFGIPEREGAELRRKLDPKFGGDGDAKRRFGRLSCHARVCDKAVDQLFDGGGEF